MSVPLHTILSAGYSNDTEKQKKDLGVYNYKLDDELSSKKHQVYYHPEKGILYNFNGTQRPKDWLTNAEIALGKKTKREKDEMVNIEKAKRNMEWIKQLLQAQVLGGSYPLK
jgi:hypothetical protein